MDLRQGIIEAANALGMSPEDLATVISYESGFRPDVWGGKNGQYYGLIQFGPAERAQYGVKVGDPSSQLGANGAIVNYMRSRGFRPGMSILDAYSTINAGSPGRYNASDNGRTSVADKVTNEFGPHRKRAAAFLGMDNIPEDMVWDMSGFHRSNTAHGQGGTGAFTGSTAEGSSSGPFTGATAAGGASPYKIPKGDEKPKTWGDAISAGLGGIGDAYAGGGGEGFSQPAPRGVVPVQQPVQQAAMPMIAPSPRDDMQRQMLAQLMAKYWIS